jgi:hypothetical protein
MLGRPQPHKVAVPTGRAPVAAVAPVSTVASAVLLEILLRLNPQLAVDPSLARELGWRARHVTGATAKGAAVTARLLARLRSTMPEFDSIHAGIDPLTSFAGG